MLVALSLVVLISMIVGLTALDRRNLAYLYAFVMPFFGVTYEVGLQVNPEKMTCLYMLLFIGLFAEQFRLKSYVMVYIAAAISITALSSWFLPDYVEQFPPLRGRLRWVFQIIYMLMAYAPLFYVPSVLKSTADVRRFLLAFVSSCLLQGAMGILQYLVFQHNGTDLFPMSLFMGEAMERPQAMFDFQNIRIMRVCALGGEPKNLAYSLVTGLIFIYLYFLVQPRSYRLLLPIALLSVSIFLTLSSQGLFLLGMVLILAPIAVNLYERKISYKRIGFTILLLGASYWLWNFTYVGKLIQSRTVERVMESSVGDGRGGLEDFDVIILSYFEDHPLAMLSGLGLGNVHFHTRDYIPKHLLYYADKNVYTSKKGIIRILSETGIIGFLLFASMWGLAIANVWRKTLPPDLQHLKAVLLLSSVFIIFNYLLTCDGPPYFILVLSALLAFRRILTSMTELQPHPCAA